jgi:ABC-type phosphonate transport system ATPase subunit
MVTSIHGRLDGVSPANLAPDSALPLELDALVKRFGAIKAVFGVSLEMRGGECLGLLGPNGAAKSIVIAWRRWVTKEFLFIRDQNLSPFTCSDPSGRTHLCLDPAITFSSQPFAAGYRRAQTAAGFWGMASQCRNLSCRIL